MNRGEIAALLKAGLFVAVLGAGLLGGCGNAPQGNAPQGNAPQGNASQGSAPQSPPESPTATAQPPAAPLPLPQPQPTTGPSRPKPGLDDRDRALLAQARRTGAQWVVLLVATAPDRGAEAAAQLEQLDGVIGTSSPGPGYLRVTMPTVNVEQAAALSAITALDVEQVVPPHNPRPTG